MKNKHKTIIFIILTILTVYSFFIEPNMLNVTYYQIKNKDLSGVKIVFVGDFHFHKNEKKRLDKVVQAISKESPDMILSIGDFVGGHELKSTLPIEISAQKLGAIKTKYGFYTVLGNHDNWVYGDEMIPVLENNNIKVLSNSNTKVKINNKEIFIAGVEDATTGHPALWKALEDAKQPTILLSHSPDIFPKIASDDVTLTLAGHLHGGQVRLPFLGSIITPSKYGNKYSYGLIQENDKTMIVTKGIGNSILNIRFNCIPEIVVIEFQ